MMIEALMVGFLSGGPMYDNTPALNAFIQSCTTDCVLHIPKGQYYFNTAPEPVTKTVHIVGDGMNDTVLYRNYNGNLLHYTAGGGSSVRNITLGAYSGSGGSALSLESQASGTSPDFFIGENINITVYNGATWGIGLNLNGVYRARQPLSGLRDLYFNNIFVFGSTTAALNINTVHGAKIYGQFYPAGGTTSKILFNAWADDKNNAIILESPYLSEVQLYNTIQSVILTSSIGSLSNIGSIVKIP